MTRRNSYGALLNSELTNGERRQKEFQQTSELQLASKEKLRIITAIHELGRRATVADVSTKTGMKLLEVQRLLNQVAAETNATLEVSEQGVIVYAFSVAFQTAYVAHGIRRLAQNIFNAVCKAFMFALRISFGIMLIASLVIIAMIGIILAMIASSSSDSDSKSSSDSGSGGFGCGRLFDGCTDIWIIDTSPSTYSYSYGYDKPSVKKSKGFFSNVFSFLFGDGNPNAHLEQRRWQVIASVIQANNGAVIAEQLAPYTGVDPKNENGMLPILVRFNGAPEVTEQGTIVYRFPDLRQTADDVKLLTTPPRSLHEFMINFSESDGGSIVMVAFLALANSLGSWWLWSNLASVQYAMNNFHPTEAMLHKHAGLCSFLQTFAPPLADSLTWLSPVLLVYGTLFVVIPIIRAVALAVINARIDSRNKKKDRLCRLVEKPSAQVKQKLEAARSQAIESTTVTKDKTVYRTDKDLLEQQCEQAANSATKQTKVRADKAANLQEDWLDQQVQELQQFQQSVKEEQQPTTDAHIIRVRSKNRQHR